MNASMHSPAISNGQVAKLLRQAKEIIIREWEKRCLEEVDAARRNDSSAVRNSLPSFLEQLAKTLENPDSVHQIDKNASVACEHGKERASLGNYHLDQVIFEYRLLREVLIQFLDLERTVASDTRHIIHSFIDEGIRNAAVEFVKIQKQHTEELIHELKISKAAAENVKNDLERFLTQAPVPLVILEGADHLFTLANPLYEELTGRKVVGKTLKEVFSQGEADYYLPILDSVFKTGNPYFGKELPLELPDSSGQRNQLWIDIGYYPFRDEQDKIKGVFALVHDVTDQVSARKKVEEVSRQIAIEQQKFEAVFLHSAGPMALFKGPDFVLEMFNRSYQALQPNRKLLLGRPLIESMPEIALSEIPRILQKVLQTGETYSTRHQSIWLKKAGSEDLEERFFDNSFSGVIGPDNEPYGILNHAVEVSESVLQKRQIEQSLGELHQERDLRERFVAALSHDLRTPMAVAKMSAQLLGRKANDESRVRAMAERIIGSIDRAEKMVRDLLDANRIKAGEGIPISIQECSLNQMIDHVLVDLRAVNGNCFQVQAGPDEIRGQWDCDALHRVLENLLSNAVKYGDPLSPIKIGLSKTNSFAELWVHNEGPAISAEDQKTLFDNYHRTASAVQSGQKGWGVGLTLVKGLVVAHQGTVRLDSAEGRGTTFYITLPIRDLDSR